MSLRGGEPLTGLSVEHLELAREIAWGHRENGDLDGAFLEIDAIASEALNQLRQARRRNSRRAPRTSAKTLAADEQRARQILRPRTGRVDNVIPLQRP